MDPQHKKALKSISLGLRHLLEGSYDAAGRWHPGDLEQRLAAIGVRRDREPVPADEMPHLSPLDRKARQVVDAYLKLRAEAGVNQTEAVAEFVRETAYTWANRLLALRCMETRDLIDEVILQKAAYGGRSLEHHRLAQRQPELCAGEDDGLLAVLDKVFAEQAGRLPMLFDPEAPGVALKPSAAVIKQCLALLSDTQKVGDQEVATNEVFKAPDAFGWAYQYWNTEEKDRVFEKVRTQKGAKIEGADVIPATQLYTEPYMVKFLVQNSLGATWMGMHPESKLCDGWEYYVRDADRAMVEKKPIAEITFLDPACGSGHFLLEAFDLFYDMHAEEGQISEPKDICRSILEKNLFGIDIDARAVQIAEAALWMKAAERAFGFQGRPTNLVAPVASHLKGPAWEEFLKTFPNEPSIARVLRQFGKAMEHIDELGSLARPEEQLRSIIHDEHATWERQITQKKEANFLFAEMAEDKLSGQLPFHEVSDEEFGERMLYRARAAIHAFTEQARQAGTFQNQFLGCEAKLGFKLFDVLSRRYTIVAANPPWMGANNVGCKVASILASYGSSRYDLYAAFISRCVSLAAESASVAMITQQSWLFLRTFSAMRADKDQETKAGLLFSSRIECLAHLGRYAFSDLGNGVIQPVMFVLRNAQCNDAHRIYAIRLKAPRLSDEQADLLKQGARRPVSGLVTRTPQSLFHSIPDSPVLYWLPEQFLSLLAKGEQLKSVANVGEGLSTSNNMRFIRTAWELRHLSIVPHAKGRWYLVTKGGGYRRWHGFQFFAVEWAYSGKRPKTYIVERYPYLNGNYSFKIKNEDDYFASALTYSTMASGALGVRRVAHAIYDNSGSYICWKDHSDDLSVLAAVLNSRVGTYLIRALTQTLVFKYKYVQSLPLPSKLEVLAAEVRSAVDWVTTSASEKSSCSPIEFTFQDARKGSGLIGYAADAVRLILEGFIERKVCDQYGLDQSAVLAIQSETGQPVGWLPVLPDMVAIPGLRSPLPDVLRKVACDAVSKVGTWSPAEISELTERLRERFIAGPDGSEAQVEGDVADDENQPGEDDPICGAFVPVPTDCFIEQLSAEIHLNPISTYWLLKSGIENEGWRCDSEDRAIVGNHVSALVLTLLGHRWPNQSESGEPLHQLDNTDGIIPLTEGTRKSMLCEQLREVCRTDPLPNGEADFAELMGKALDQWLPTEFFKYHTSQFKKRPIAWQVQSGKFTARAKPAFASLVYYHKLDGDLLEKIRTQYVGPLRQRWETELRGIESVTKAARSERQTDRGTELGDLLKELQDFHACLRSVQESGFETKELREYAIQDALLCAKSRWLRRLSAKIQVGPLGGWKKEADNTGIHEHLSTWIEEAMTHLNRHCTEVGPSEWKSTDEPMPVSLAALICKNPAALVTKAMECANQHWWDQLNEVVLAPLRQDMNEKKETLKGVQAELKELDGKNIAAVGELKDEERKLKREIKQLKDEIAEIVAQAGDLKDRIAAWKCREADGWESWLAEQPMYDAISSTDGHRQPPTTVQEWIAQERSYIPDINDGVRVNIAPLQKAGVLAAEVLAKKDVDKAIADRAEWRADERRWVREGKLPQPGWWPEG